MVFWSKALQDQNLVQAARADLERALQAKAEGIAEQSSLPAVPQQTQQVPVLLSMLEDLELTTCLDYKIQLDPQGFLWKPVAT